MAPVLGYWDIRGLAEYIRYLLAHAGVEYEDKRYGFGPGPDYSRDEWLADKPNLGLDFPNLPYYLDGDVKLTQSLAILRHLGKEHGLLPDTDEARRNVDVLEMQAFDLYMSVIRLSYDPAYTEEKRDQYLKEFAPAKLREYEAYLAKNGPFVAGKKVTYVDFLLYESLQAVRALAPGSFKRNYPALVKYCEEVASLPGLREYLESPRFKAWPFMSPYAKALSEQDEPLSDDS